ncbi:unnamed protein product [Lathyrus sativus]|nr:unnamed protein product [Lathyrus sativus]
MGYSTVVTKVVCLAIVCLVSFGPNAGEAVPCGQVVNSLMPCVSYIMNGGSVPLRCCDGVKGLNNMARTPADRRDVCTCIKNAVTSSGFSYSNTNLGNAASLPTKCGVNIPYRISPNTDCKSVN